MTGKQKKNLRFFIALVSLMLPGLPAVAGTTNKPMAAATDNPLKVEMQLLLAAYNNLTTSLLLNKLDDVEAPFHQVHKAKSATEKAIVSKAIKLPKNPDNIKEFLALDEKFHQALVQVLVASRAKDRTLLLTHTQSLLAQCVQCHLQFRE